MRLGIRAGWMLRIRAPGGCMGDVPTGRKSRAVPGLWLQKERSSSAAQTCTVAGPGAGWRPAQASGPGSGVAEPGGAESAAITGGGAFQGPV